MNAPNNAAITHLPETDANATTTALLTQAWETLKAAERRLAEQEKKIRELEDIACTDPLTGLMNRRGFEKFFCQEQERLRRQQSSGCLLVMIDLDHLKEINDTCGHAAGDTCLRMASRYLQQSLRLLDGAARLGGDEFAVLLTQTDTDKAAERLSLIQKILGSMYIEWEGRRLSFGASIGVEEVTEKDDYAAICQRADRKMYREKHARRKARDDSAASQPANGGHAALPFS